MESPQILEHLLHNDLITDVSKKRFEELRHEAIAQIALDSRKIEPVVGTVLFFAVDGENFDGHSFINEALQKNPSAIIVSEKFLDKNFERSLQVNDLKKTMAIVSKKFFLSPDDKIKLIAITGTNGKTTTAHLCRSLLGKISKTGVFGTVEYDLGGQIKQLPNTTPDAINLFKMISEAAKNGCKNLAIEISSHGLVNKRAYELNVDVAVFMNLSSEHLDFHKTMDEYFLAKKKLFDGENGCHPKHVVVNIDDLYGRQLVDFLKKNRDCVLTFGFSNDADFKICEIQKNDLDGTHFSLKSQEKVYKISSNLFGRFNMLNIAASFIASMLIYNDPEKFLEAIANFRSVAGRLEKINLPNGSTAFVDYAHTPYALEMVLKALNLVKKRKLITVFGCGGSRDSSKRAPMTQVVNQLSDLAIATSENPRKESQKDIFKDMSAGVVNTKKIQFIVDRKKAILSAIQQSHPGDIILIAGKGHETYQIVGDKTIEFDDKKVIAEIFQSATKEA